MSVGYFSLFANQPGIKGAVYFEAPSSDLFISPQVAYFSKDKDQTNWLLNLEIGKDFMQDGKNRYVSFAGGLGYWRQTTDALNDHGSSIFREAIIDSYVVPSISFEMGWRYNQVGWYLKNSLGSKLGKDVSSLVIFLELGLKISLTSVD